MQAMSRMAQETDAAYLEAQAERARVEAEIAAMRRQMFEFNRRVALALGGGSGGEGGGEDEGGEGEGEDGGAMMAMGVEMA